jgi:hypothetical protein
MVKELSGYSRIISSLVELEYIQQTLDIQEEQDKHGVSLFGLGEVNMTYQDLIQKSGFKDMKSKLLNPLSRSIAIQVKSECLNCEKDDVT